MIPPQDSQAMLIYWQKQGLLLWQSMLVWNTVQTGYFALYWCSSLKGNGLENLDVFKRQQGLQGHYTFLILLTLPSQLRLADKRGSQAYYSLISGMVQARGKLSLASFRDGWQCNVRMVGLMSIPTTATIIIISSIYGMWNWSLCNR